MKSSQPPASPMTVLAMKEEITSLLRKHEPTKLDKLQGLFDKLVGGHGTPGKSQTHAPVASKPTLYCGYSGCNLKPAPPKCSRCREVNYCSKKHQTEHWKLHKKICVTPEKKKSAMVPPAPTPVSVAVKGEGEEEEEEDENDYKDKCIVCLDNVANAKLRLCRHSATCKGCTESLMNLNEPCPLCRKSIAWFILGKWKSSISEHGLWPTSLKNLTQLASGEGFNEYFQKLFVGNEASYLRWKESQTFG
ncbi:hypothetical protein TrLO_g2559 [Triparma laevis f. longispina]|uniref:Uncharacterized protein n=1 Tax=Triparma laevis f. longispina TaxID=1714387 RepID=A0A9W6Z729_9STRA|nr:hypothetical protein TrLO_g2559 [Triparma laevis f. longispina]